MAERTLAVVDPVSSGALLAPELTKAGCRCIAVLSQDPLPPIFLSSYRPTDFAKVVVHSGDLVQTVAALRKCGVDSVIAGAESGVALSDALSADLKLETSNGLESSPARRDKFRMAVAAARGGLRTPRQAVFADLAKLVAWRARHLDWPVIVKPLSSVASDGVNLCRSESEIEAAFRALTTAPDILGRINDKVLLQAYLDGEEFVVDSVSFARRHEVAAYWRYGRGPGNDAFVCYNYIELMPYDGALQERLAGFARIALDQLGIRHGPAHCEIMLVGEQLYLIEVGARMAAGSNSYLSRLCGGPCQLDLTLACYLGTGVANSSPPKKLSKWAANYFLRPPRRGLLRSLKGVERIEVLASLRSFSISAKPGEAAPAVAGLVTLLADDEAALRDDLRRLTALESGDFYQIEP